jgi:LPXTG-site transpeptidase (sortase) family protein
MHNPHLSGPFEDIVLLIILFLVTLSLGTGKLPFATSENARTALAANEVIGGSPGVDGLSFSHNSKELISTPPDSTPTFLPTGTYYGQFVGTPTPPQAAIPTLQGKYVPDVVVVKIDPAITANNLQNCLKSANATVGSQIKEINVMQVDVPKGEVAEAIASLSKCPGVLYAEPDYVAVMADTIPNDPGWPNQYGLMAIHAPQGWDANTGSPAVTIAIVDTGVDLSHADLAGKIVPGIDFVNGDNIPQDDNGHGTHVAGIAAAITNNAIGVAGVSWGARIMPVKVLDATGTGSIANVAAGIVWAAQNGAEVINISLGCGLLSCPTPPQALLDAVNYAYGEGATLVAAAGNLGTNFVYYPARFPHVIAVAATDQVNNHWTLSNYGPEVDVSAPGVQIYSTFRGNIYRYLDGTSMSTAFVSGLAAILRGLPTYSSPDQIAEKLGNSALDLGAPGRDDLYGFGLIQVDAAIQSFQPTPTPTFTPTFTPTPTSPANTPAAAILLPATGFSPNYTTILPVQPDKKAYADMRDFWLEIPRLQVEVPIVGVPLIDNVWDVSWLGNQAGWLNGTAFPTHAGNSVISAHVYDASGKPGPFVHLDSLVWGDQVIVHAFGQQYVYSVRESVLASPGAVSSVIRHEEYPWLTLITCQGYDEASNSYRTRVVVRAVQVEIK